jgi:hypothetical protein
MLPALLESMVLTFAETPTRGKAAFNAYRTMIDLGYGGQTQQEFVVRGDLKEYLQSGNLLRNPIDERRHGALISAEDAIGRKNAILAYLDGNLERFEELKNQPLEDSHWRNNIGAVEPVDTISIEILKDLTRGYSEVRKAVDSFNSSPSPQAGDKRYVS